MEENITTPTTPMSPTEPTAPEAETKPTPTFDDVLKDPAMQEEFDRRVAKGITTAKAKWEMGQNVRITSGPAIERPWG